MAALKTIELLVKTECLDLEYNVKLNARTIKVFVAVFCPFMVFEKKYITILNNVSFLFDACFIFLYMIQSKLKLI